MIAERLIDRLAEAVHEQYLREQLADGVVAGANPAMRPWSELPEDLREANRAQARAIGDKLAAVGASVVPAARANGAFAFTDAEVEELARAEHDRWTAQRVQAGWVHGDRRDDAARTHPSVVGWADLPEAERDKDRDAVRNLPAVLAAVGLAAVRRA